jgi:hypothetical protein
MTQCFEMHSHEFLPLFIFGGLQALPVESQNNTVIKCANGNQQLITLLLMKFFSHNKQRSYVNYCWPVSLIEYAVGMKTVFGNWAATAQ